MEETNASARTVPLEFLWYIWLALGLSGGEEEVLFPSQVEAVVVQVLHAIHAVQVVQVEVVDLPVP